MTVSARPHWSSRAILVWLLLAAYVCAPLAAWAQPRQLAIVVPYCTGQGLIKAGTRLPRRIVLRFPSHAQVSANHLQLALPTTVRQACDRPETTNVDATRRREPVAAPALAWRPPPRAPPGSTARV